MRLHCIHHCLTWHYIPCIHTFNHIYALDMTHILCTMDQEPPQQALIHTGNLDSMYTMDLMSVMPQCIQLSWNALQHQTPLQLSFPTPNGSSFPLPSIPSSAQIEPHIWTPSSHNNQNNQNNYFYNANSHNNQNCPFYDTWELPFLQHMWIILLTHQYTCVRGRCKHGRNESSFAMAIVLIEFYLYS